MRNILTFTIDPKDAKDFDDALSFQVLENGKCISLCFTKYCFRRRSL